MKQVPNLFTLLNLFFGCIAIVFVLQNGITIFASPEGSQLIDIPEQIWMASLFIGLAALVDFLDGFLARLFGASSEMGKQLDSLADVVSFGVAPGLIIYQFLRLSVAQEDGGIDSSMLWLVPAFVLPCAGAWRLARYNLQTGDSGDFQGVPIPAVGLVVGSLPLIYWNVEIGWVRDLLLSKWFLYALTAVLSALMVSKLDMLAFKFRSFGLKQNAGRYLVLLIAVIALPLLKWLAIPVIFLAYVLVSLAFKNRNA